jgi:hypothetical protein
VYKRQFKEYGFATKLAEICTKLREITLKWALAKG